MAFENGCDRELAQGVAKGDRASVAAFFLAYHAGVYRYMLCLTGNREDAEDLAQDSLLQAKARIRTYRGEAGLRTWVHSVAYRTFTHWNRRRKPRLEPKLPATGMNSALDAVEASEVLLAALSKLGPALAQPLVLMEVVDLSVDEIAQIMSIPPGTVKSRLHAARHRLRQILGGPL